MAFPPTDRRSAGEIMSATIAAKKKAAGQGVPPKVETATDATRNKKREYLAKREKKNQKKEQKQRIKTIKNLNKSKSSTGIGSDDEILLNSMSRKA